jgi:hypothetical protein
VIPSNAGEILKQWTEVHGLPLSPSDQTIVDGYPREVWINGAGDEMIESYTITNMAHGTPLAPDGVEGACGAAGPFLLQVGISSSYHIAKFFGIAGAQPNQSASAGSNLPTLPLAAIRLEKHAAPKPVLEGEVLEKEDKPMPRQDPTLPFPEISTVINKALKAAGLIKE